MKVPSSPNKRYLSGADWCVAALSEGTILTTGRRCLFQVAVFLDGVPDGDRLAAAFRDFCARFPVLWGRASRCWCLAPYWKQAAAADPGRPVHVGCGELPEGVDEPEVLRYIERLVNSHAAGSGWTTALDIVQVGADAGLLLFSFDHCLFDAVGGETFIDLFFRQINGEAGEDEFPPPRQTADAQLDQWRQKFKSGQKVNRMMRRLAAAETAWLPLPRDAHQRPFRFRVATFDVPESRRIQARAFQVAGYLMFTPYVLATAAAVLRPYFERRSASATHFVVSVSTDKPKTAVRAPHLFFNDLSFLYFQFPVAAAVDRDALAGTVRDQLIRQAKEGVPAAIEDANLLMRILPARLFWRFFMRLYRSRLSSFGFTCLGESALRTRTVMGCRVRDQIHFPIIPAPPGFGLILSQSEGVYHMVLSYLEGMLPEDEVDAIMQDFRARLLE